MNYTPHTARDVQHMLEVIGVSGCRRFVRPSARIAAVESPRVAARDQRNGGDGICAIAGR